MTQRIDAMTRSPAFFKKLVELSLALKKGAIEQSLLDLVHIRASQLNGCAFCLDMHVKEAKIHGERELRLHHVAIWRESPQFSRRERAALAWTEAATRLGEHGVDDAVYDQVRGVLSEQELSDLTFSVAAINAWNRINVALRPVPGSADQAFGLDKAGLS